MRPLQIRTMTRAFQLTAGLLAAAIGPAAPALAAPAPAELSAPDRSGPHDFDFEIGDWRVHHRVKRPTGDHPWLEFDGTCSTRSLMGGSANVEEHVFDKPT